VCVCARVRRGGGEHGRHLASERRGCSIVSHLHFAELHAFFPRVKLLLHLLHGHLQIGGCTGGEGCGGSRRERHARLKRRLAWAVDSRGTERPSEERERRVASARERSQPRRYCVPQACGRRRAQQLSGSARPPANTHHFAGGPVDGLEYGAIRAIAKLLRHFVPIHRDTSPAQQEAPPRSRLRRLTAARLV